MYPKPWLCPSGHTLGEINTCKADSGVKVRKLYLYRQADNPADVIAEITGPVVNIACSICGCTRDWHIGDEAIQELLEKHKISHTIPQVSS